MKLEQLDAAVLLKRRLLKPEMSDNLKLSGSSAVILKTAVLENKYLPDIDLTALSSTKNTIFIEHLPVAAFG